MKVFKLLGMAFLFAFVSCGTTQVINSGNAATDELSVLETADNSININAVDGTELPVNTHSVSVAAGEHEITLSYHNVGGTNAIVTMMNYQLTRIMKFLVM